MKLTLEKMMQQLLDLDFQVRNVTFRLKFHFHLQERGVCRMIPLWERHQQLHLTRIFTKIVFYALRRVVLRRVNVRLKALILAHPTMS